MEMRARDGVGGCFAIGRLKKDLMGEDEDCALEEQMDESINE